MPPAFGMTDSFSFIAAAPKVLEAGFILLTFCNITRESLRLVIVHVDNHAKEMHKNPKTACWHWVVVGSASRQVPALATWWIAEAVSAGDCGEKETYFLGSSSRAENSVWQ